MNYPIVKIKDDRIISVERRHPWIFSRGILSIGSAKDGDIVEVRSRGDKYLATGYYQDGSIMVRILSFVQVEINKDFWKRHITRAKELRAHVGLPNATTNAYRLIHGEGDGLPGLIVDIYNNVAVIQCHTIGIHRMIQDISEAIQEVMGDQISTIYDKSKNKELRKKRLELLPSLISNLHLQEKHFFACFCSSDFNYLEKPPKSWSLLSCPS